ncbi:thiamine phosphate synthase [Endozoicomonas elysicola]|uniref:Thiamine-phosphate synthase n=1 Tax=Endozoicomonas elysicola TaxID=305900 RepID=A0A081K8Q3_9GAMM|nr:thiamine phosphate synthase [Endozoicomonas elysicola]KEI70529.1 thiamine-phosphate pyrophosphorylase [Endozoicomonas elysicola]
MHRLHGLYGVTDSQLQPDDRILIETVEQALMGGMKVLQYRDKSLDSGKRLRQAGALKVLCHQYQAMLIINDDIELALDVEADGVHLGQQDESLAYARERLGDYAIIGISCENSLEKAKTAVEQGANYIAFGKFFPSRTKPDAKNAELSILSEARQMFDLPIIAIGGITMENASDVITAGADMVAVVNNLFAAQNIRERSQNFMTLFNDNSPELNKRRKAV